MSFMSLELTEELIARQSPEAQASIPLLLARIQELEDRLSRTPWNSSSPPSVEHPHAKPGKPKRRSRKKRGGQPGHVKHERPLIPVEDCTEVIPLKPSECRRCGATLPQESNHPADIRLLRLVSVMPQSQLASQLLDQRRIIRVDAPHQDRFGHRLFGGTLLPSHFR
jgi:transposase